jgi:hypothetical protein
MPGCLSGPPQEVVDVTAEAPVVETTRSQTSTVVGQKAIADLPINGRNFLDFAVLTPGLCVIHRAAEI